MIFCHSQGLTLLGVNDDDDDDDDDDGNNKFIQFYRYFNKGYVSFATRWRWCVMD
jgi:hypothetical protein